MLRLAFIIDPLPSLKIYKDSTYAMMVEAASRGHELFVLEPHDLAVVDGEVVADVTPLRLTSDLTHWYEADEPRREPLTSFHAVLMRKDPPFDIEYVYSTYLLELAEKQGARVFNNPRSIRDHNEKFSITEFPQFTAPTLITRNPAQVREFLAAHQHIVLKPLDGMGGSSIFVVKQGDPNLSVILETMIGPGRTIMAQRYIPEIVDGDKRVLVIGGEPVPYCLARIPMIGESRGNLAAGGTGVARELTERDLEIATTVGPPLMERGLLLVGLDVIGDNLTEINVTSPTCFQEITEQTGFNVAGMFVDALEAVVGYEA